VQKKKYVNSSQLTSGSNPTPMFRTFGEERHPTGSRLSPTKNLP